MRGSMGQLPQREQELGTRQYDSGHDQAHFGVCACVRVRTARLADKPIIELQDAAVKCWQKDGGRRA